MSRVMGLIEYVIAQKFIEPKIIDALYDYFSDVSPSIVCERYQISKHTLRRHVQNVYSRTRLGFLITSKLFRRIVDLVREIDIVPAFEHGNGHANDGYARCKLCGKLVPAPNRYILWLHLVREHKELVETIIDEVLEKLTRTVVAQTAQARRH